MKKVFTSLSFLIVLILLFIGCGGGGGGSEIGNPSNNTVSVTGTVSGTTFYALDNNDIIVGRSVASGNPKRFLVNIPAGMYKFMLVENEGTLDQRAYFIYQESTNLFSVTPNTDIDMGFITITSGKGIPSSNLLSISGVSSVGESITVPPTLFGVNASRVYYIPTYNNIVVDGNRVDWETTPGFIDHTVTGVDLLDSTNEPRVWVHICTNTSKNMLYFGFYLQSWSNFEPRRTITMILNNAYDTHSFEIQIYPEAIVENGVLIERWIANIFRQSDGVLVRTGQVSINNGFYEASFDISGLGLANNFVIHGKSVLFGSMFVDYFMYDGIVRFY